MGISRGRLWLAGAVVVAILASCATWPIARAGRQAAGTTVQALPAAAAIPPIVGVVRFPGPARRVQATMTDIASASTVALIDTSTDTTVASTLTDTNGNFLLNIASWTPTPGKVYDLEAVKGLANNLPANNAARVRTLIAFNSTTGWASITAGSTVIVDPYTTALSAGAALLNAQAGPFNFSSLLNSLSALTNPDTYAPVPGLSATDYATLSSLVNQALLNNEDPIATIGLRLPDTWVEPNTSPVATTVSPSSLSALQEGALITLTGSGFDPDPANDIIKFDGTQGVVTSATPLQLTVSSRGLIGGQISIQVGNLVTMGPTYGMTPFVVNDGTTSAGVDLAYQYSPVGGSGYLDANWTANANATSYLEQIGSTPGASDILAAVNVGNVTSYQATNLTVQGAWTGSTYYVTITPVYPSGDGTPVTSNGVQIAEAPYWDGVSTTGLRNAPDGGYSVNFPPGSNQTQFYGNHYFETVNIAAGTTTYVQPFGKVDGIGQGAAMSGNVASPKDGWLGIHANTITVAGLIDASGRGYGGGPGGSMLNNSASNGYGGALGLSGAGGGGQYNASASASGFTNGSAATAVGGPGYGGAGGGAEAGTVLGARGGYMGGGGGGSAYGNAAPGNGNDLTAAGGTGADSGGGIGGAAPSYFGPSFGAGSGGGGGSPAAQNATGGGGGGGYGAGGAGGTGDIVYTAWADAGGGGGGTGGGNTYSGSNASSGGNTGGTSFGLGWAPGIQSRGNDGYGGPAGDYVPGGAAVGDTSTDLSWLLGSGGAGGDPRCMGCGSLGQSVWDDETGAGAGGGAGGGAIILMGQSITVSGALVGIGAAGGGGSGDDGNGGAGGGGGGGSGGAIVIHAPAVSITGTLNVLGGTAGGNGNGGTTGGTGGNGGVSSATGGTIKVFYHTFSGTLPTTTTAGRVYTSAF